jgi:phage gp36-like protein
MRKFLLILFLVSALVAPAFAGIGPVDPVSESPAGGGIMGYCTLADLEGAYGAENISGWSRLDPDRVDRAIGDASAEIDGYLISGGYQVPLAGPPANLTKYCIDIAAANLVVSAGVLKDDPGGNAVLEQAKNARHYLTKVAEGKFRIPGYAGGEGEVSKPPSGNVLVSAPKRLDLGGY